MRSTQPARIAENGSISDFALDAASMAQLDAFEENLTTGWNPSDQA